MARRTKAKTWVKNNRGSEPDVHELVERISEQVNEDEPLQQAADAVRVALAQLDTELDMLGWTD
jgi:hypothetical protein